MLSHIYDCCRICALWLVDIELGKYFRLWRCQDELMGILEYWQEQLELLDIPALSVDELSRCPDKFEILHCGWRSRFRFTLRSLLERAVACRFCATYSRSLPRWRWRLCGKSQRNMLQV